MTQQSASATYVADTTGTQTIDGVTTPTNQQNGHGRVTLGSLDMLVRNPGATATGRNGEVEAYGRTVAVSGAVSAELLNELRTMLAGGITIPEAQGFKTRVDDAMDDGLLNQSIPPRPLVGDNLGKRRPGG